MTNERAVEILNLDLDILGQYGDETAEAYKMAIKALKQQPCEDCISREAVKEQMIRYGFKAPDMTVTEFVEDCLPSVTPQPKKGKWTRDLKMWFTRFSCSNCGKFCDFDYLYCPNCGSYNGGEKE